MGKVRSALPLTLLISLMLSMPAIAGPVYLADGAIVEAQKAWRSEGKVYVLVNRDVLLSFAPEEVNIKKTFVKQKSRTKLKTKAGAVRPTAASRKVKSHAKAKPVQPPKADKPDVAAPVAKPVTSTAADGQAR